VKQQKTTMAKTYTLITGASLGIGKSLAYECARRGMNLILVALPGNELTILTETIKRKYAVDAISYPVDLTKDHAPEHIFNWCKENNFQVSALINNAGIGAGGLFENIKLTQYMNMLKLNNQALIELTYYFVPELKKNPKSYILNTSSMEGLIPLPYKTVYTATKNFIFSFSIALREELKPSNVNVSVLCPGPVVTNKDGLMRIKAHGARARLITMMPSQVAKIALKKMVAGKGIIVPGYLNLTLTRLIRLVPMVTRMKLLEHMFRVYKTMPQETIVRLDTGVKVTEESISGH
jgi:uncharacterized protein